MRIGMLSHWYDPEGGAAAGPGTIARALVSRGHEVEVVTGHPIYPEGRLFPGYRMRMHGVEHLRGVIVHRAPVYPSHDTRALHRMANYLSYAATGSVLAPSALKAADVALVYSTPATAATPALALKALRRLPYVLHVQDLWPQTITASGFIKGGRAETVERILHRYCDTVYRHAHHIAVTSPGMADLIEQRGVPRTKISLLPNWADEASFYPVARDPMTAAQLGLSRPFVVMYAGNLGEMQNLSVVIEAAKRLRGSTDIQFAFVGNGVLKERLQRDVDSAQLDNVVFVESQPFERMADVLACGDVQLVSLKDVPLYRSTLPSKIQANLACGRPILAALAGDGADVVRASDSGIVVAPGDVEGFVSAVQTMRGVPALVREQWGLHARRYYEEHFSTATVLDELEQLLQRAARQSR